MANKKIMKRTLAMVLAISMLSVSLVGCGAAPVGTPSTPASTPAESSASQSGSGADTPTTGAVTLPLTDKPVTITIWRPLHASAAKYITNTIETASARALEKATGVKVVYQHPPVGQEKNAFSILLASGDYPDIIQMNNVEYPGGGDAALNDEVFLKLNDLIDQYAPNYKAMRESDEIKRKMTITDEGNIWAFYHMHDVAEGPFNGMSVRKDWLTELGLPAPETIDDWYTMLKAFKDQKGCTAPLVAANNASVGYKTETFASAFGVAREFYVDNNKVKYGPSEPGYREYIETMRKWYGEGLIDPDFLTRTNINYMAYPPMDLVGNDQSGAFPNNWDMTGEYWVEMGSAKDKAFFAQPVPAPVKNKGDKLHIGFATYPVLYPSAISASCKNPEIAVKLMDFLYTQQGSDILNYGEEGVTFNYVDGKPVFTDEIMNPTDGRTPRDAIISKTFHDGMGLMDYRRFWQVSNVDRLGAIEIWQSNNDYVGNLPAISLSVEEADKRNAKYPDILTFVNERTIQYIIGSASMDTYDAFVAQLNSMGINEIIALNQAALDRYNKR